MRGGRWVFRVRTEAAMTNVRVGPYTLFRPNDILRAGSNQHEVGDDALSGRTRAGFQCLHWCEREQYVEFDDKEYAVGQRKTLPDR